MSKVNLETFAGGALQEKVDRAMDEVLQNMQDPNTPWKNKRGITIKISFLNQLLHMAVYGAG
jgi:hypothetical protein